MNKIILKKITHKLKIYHNKRETKRSIKLLGTEIDKQLKFIIDNHNFQSTYIKVMF